MDQVAAQPPIVAQTPRSVAEAGTLLARG